MTVWLMAQDILNPAAIFLAGAMTASLLCCLAERRALGLSILFPGSFCPFCKKPLKAWHLVPVLGFLLLRGRCGFCRRSIPAASFVHELALGFVWTVLWLIHGMTPAFAQNALLTAFLVTVSEWDRLTGLIPDRLILPACILWQPLALAAGQPVLPGLVWGLAAAALPAALYLVWYRVRGVACLGLGDVKLVLFMGMVLHSHVFFALFLASLACLICAHAGLRLCLHEDEYPETAGTSATRGPLAHTQPCSNALPFAPWLSLGTAAAVILRAAFPLF